MNDSRFWLSAQANYEDTHDESDAPDDSSCALCGGPVGEDAFKDEQGNEICRQCEVDMPEPE